MNTPSSTLYIIPVLSSSDIERDLAWYEKHTGFNLYFGDKGYSGLQRDNLEFHLQWHHNNDDDPVYPSVMKIFVKDIQPYYEEFVKRGTIPKDKLRMNTPWGTHEFGFYDLNNNAIFIVQDA
ncbi:glyoxalase/bleomycin resistance/extradiol dioxygenase family protein [Ekhidna sp.]|uniref:glyoxalase/bleomycin resistance/extradiol dioxygenase family protein n=1 Tax=Ekhidna sp. TaxID=2608089 RepID=UPI003BAD175A